MSEIKVSAGWLLLSCEGQSVPGLSRGLLAFLRVPCLVDTSPQSLPSSSHTFLPVGVSVSKLPLYIRTPAILD